MISNEIFKIDGSDLQSYRSLQRVLSAINPKPIKLLLRKPLSAILIHVDVLVVFKYISS